MNIPTPDAARLRRQQQLSDHTERVIKSIVHAITNGWDGGLLRVMPDWEFFAIETDPRVASIVSERMAESGWSAHYDAADRCYHVEPLEPAK